MDAYPTDRAVSYLDQSPLLVAGTSDAAISRALRTIEARGGRVGQSLPIEQAGERIELQVSASAVWIELDRDCGGAMDALLTQVNRDVRNGRYAAIVSAVPELVDPVATLIDDSDVQLLIDADDAERAAALAIATAIAERPVALSDVASDQNAARLRQLSEEVSRIATTLARLSTGPQAEPRRAAPPPSAEIPEVSPEAVRAVIRARRLRARYFPEELFADPAWDMLLDLLQAELSHLRVPVSSLCIAAAVPATTALRWLKTMVQEKLFVRRADPHDGRRVFVELAPETSYALRRYFAEVGQIGLV
jgi:hypothetical protein